MANGEHVQIPFPPGRKPEPSEVADWAELRALTSTSAIKRSDIRSAITHEDVDRPEELGDETWHVLSQRAVVCGARWPLVLAGSRISRRRHSRVSLSLYRFLTILSLGDNVPSDDRALFEDVVASLLAPLIGRAGFRTGHPARAGQDSSFRRRIERYEQLSGLTSMEIGREPLPHDKDLGMDAVAWRRFADGRGGDVHLVAQCSTGGDWEDKLHDLDLEVWKPHLAWAPPPLRVFATPRIILLPTQRWIRVTRRGGLILDRPRLLELSLHSRLPPRLLRQMQARLRDRNKQYASY